MEEKVLDQYGTKIKAGDSVCFIHKHSMQAQHLVKAIVKEVQPMKKSPDFPGVNENRGWVIIDRYVDDHMAYEKNAKKKVLAERVIKCF